MAGHQPIRLRSCLLSRLRRRHASIGMHLPHRPQRGLAASTHRTYKSQPILAHILRRIHGSKPEVQLTRTNLATSQIHPANPATARAEPMPKPIQVFPTRHAKPLYPGGRDIQPGNAAVFRKLRENKTRLHKPDCSWDKRELKTIQKRYPKERWARLPAGPLERQ